MGVGGIMKILFVQHLSFINGSGGTEKVCSFLANYFCDLGYEVEVATNENIEGKEVYPLREEIKLTNIYSEEIKQIKLLPIKNYKGKNPFLWLKYKFIKKKTKFQNRKIIRQHQGEDNIYLYNLRQRAKAWGNFIKNISKPDLIITMSLGSVLEISFENNLNIPIINSTNGRPDHDFTDVLWYRSKIDMKLLENSFQELSATQILFDDYKNFLPENFTGRYIHIGNPIPEILDNELVNHLEEKEKYIIIHIGSLVLSHKQQDILIRSFKTVVSKFPNWELHFWGVGRDKSTIEDLIKIHKLENSVFLKGFTPNPIEELKKADIFVFPSRHEGFPLALGEAMSVGLPSIGLADCSGVNQMIVNEENGFLAKEEMEVERYLEMLMSNPELRQKMGQKANEFAKNFSPEKITLQWKHLVEEVMNEKNK